MASKTLPNAELVQVGGQYGEPYINFGEFCIISKETTIDGNHNKLCYVRHNEGVVIGVVTIRDETKLSVMGNTERILDKRSVIECRRVKWIQKR